MYLWTTCHWIRLTMNLIDVRLIMSNYNSRIQTVTHGRYVRNFLTLHAYALSNTRTHFQTHAHTLSNTRTHTFIHTHAHLQTDVSPGKPRDFVCSILYNKLHILDDRAHVVLFWQCDPVHQVCCMFLYCTRTARYLVWILVVCVRELVYGWFNFHPKHTRIFSLDLFEWYVLLHYISCSGRVKLFLWNNTNKLYKLPMEPLKGYCLKSL